MLYKLKYELKKPDFLPSIEEAYFPDYNYFGFLNSDKRNSKDVVRIMRRKSIDIFFTDENIKLLKERKTVEPNEGIFDTQNKQNRTDFNSYGHRHSNRTPPLGTNHSGRRDSTNLNFMDENFTSNENIERSEESNENEIRINPDLLFTTDQGNYRGENMFKKY